MTFITTSSDPMTQSRRTVYLYVLETLADWEIGFVTAELNSGRYLADPDAVTMTTVGATTQPIRTMGGMSVTPEAGIDEVTFHEGDALILPGADTWMNGSHTSVLDRTETLLEDGVTVAAICGATVALAQTGTLDDREHTSNDGGFLKMACPAYRGEECYRNVPVVVDGSLITASGLAPLEFAHALFGELDAMRPDVLTAWYDLYRTRDPLHFQALMAAMGDG